MSFFSKEEQVAEGKVILTGQIYRLETQNEKTILYLKKPSVSEGNPAIRHTIRRNQRGIAYLEGNQSVHIGQTVVLEGTVSSFSHAGNPGEFDYADYYESLGITFRIYDASVLLAGKKRNQLLDGLHKTKQELGNNLGRYYEEEDLGILKAMLLGEKKEISQEIRESFQLSGISHVLAISGVHISILGMGLFGLLRRGKLPYTAAMVLSVGGMMLYGIMVGMSASALRAILMFALRLNAKRIGRTYDMPTAMALAATGILLLEPSYVNYTGFQLSFAAIMGIACVHPAMENLFLLIMGRGKTDHLWDVGQGNFLQRGVVAAKKSLLASFSVTLSTTPVLLYHYYEMSFYSIFFNLFVLPTVAAVLVCGIVVAVFGGISFGPVQMLLYGISRLGHMILFFYRKGSELVGKLPGNRIRTGRPQLWQLICYIFLLLFLVFGTERALEKRKQNRRRARGLGGIYAGVLLAAVAVLLIGRVHAFRITVLSVGQGDSICIENRKGHAILVDCGSSSLEAVGERILVPFLKYEGVREIDAIFITHLDADHISGIEELLTNYRKDFRIEKIILAKEIPKDEAYASFCELLGECGIRPETMQIGDCYQNGELRLRCIGPGKEQGVSGDRNVASLILYLCYRDFDAILAGDADAEAELAAAKRLEIYEPRAGRIDYIKVSHHGSKTASSEEYLSKTRPLLATVSAGLRNRYGHPHEETIEKLEKYTCRYYLTAQSGAITLVVKNKRIKVSLFLDK